MFGRPPVGRYGWLAVAGYSVLGCGYFFYIDREETFFFGFFVPVQRGANLYDLGTTTWVAVADYEGRYG